MENPTPESTSPDVLIFGTPDFALGEPQTTVRRGDKWIGAEGTEVEVAALDPEGHPFPIGIRARIEGVQRFEAFANLPDGLVATNHDESARTIDGLFDAMVAAYGEDFSVDEEVTLVTFVPFQTDVPEATTAISEPALGRQEPVEAETLQEAADTAASEAPEDAPPALVPDSIEAPNTRDVVRGVVAAAERMAPGEPKRQVPLLRKVIQGLQDAVVRL